MSVKVSVIIPVYNVEIKEPTKCGRYVGVEIENVEPKEFFDILGLNYLNLIRENPLASHKNFEDDYNQKVHDLSIAIKNFEIEKMQSQPE